MPPTLGRQVAEQGRGLDAMGETNAAAAAMAPSQVPGSNPDHFGAVREKAKTTRLVLGLHLAHHRH
jgi:hypothetical protein